MPLSSRQKQIMDHLHETNGVLSSAEITAQFNVTVQTIRKDLNDLSERGLVRRVHGGIRLPSDDRNLSFNNRTVLNLTAKQRIARKTVELFPENTTIFLGIGTTPQQVAQALLDHPGLTVVTNNINAALTLCSHSNIQTYLAGGRVRANDQDTMGIDTAEFMSKFNLQYGVFGVGGMNQKGQLLDFSPEESGISQTIIKNCEARVLVVDHTKLDRYAPVITSGLEDIDFLVMDYISEPIKQLCSRWEIEMFEVGPKAEAIAC